MPTYRKYQDVELSNIFVEVVGLISNYLMRLWILMVLLRKPEKMNVFSVDFLEILIAVLFY